MRVWNHQAQPANTMSSTTCNRKTQSFQELGSTSYCFAICCHSFASMCCVVSILICYSIFLRALQTAKRSGNKRVSASQTGAIFLGVPTSSRIGATFTAHFGCIPGISPNSSGGDGADSALGERPGRRCISLMYHRCTSWPCLQPTASFAQPPAFRACVCVPTPPGQCSRGWSSGWGLLVLRSGGSGNRWTSSS